MYTPPLLKIGDSPPSSLRDVFLNRTVGVRNEETERKRTADTHPTPLLEAAVEIMGGFFF